MVNGWLGAAGFMLTVNDCAALLPQALFALTVMAPPVVPGVAFIVVVVEDPAHPDGSAQV
jgi:hypothetical protein